MTDPESSQALVMDLLKDENKEDELWDFMDTWTPDKQQEKISNKSFQEVMKIC